MTKGFVFDQTKCTGCQACILACTIENDLAPNQSWRSVFSFNERHLPELPVVHLSLACNHCEEPACMAACPASAYSQDEATGFVMLDGSKCIGCRYCTWACPFGAPQFDAAEGVVSKCTFCESRLSEGLSPACVDLCPTGALSIADRVETDGGSNPIGMPITQMRPAITLEANSKPRRAPEISAPKSANHGAHTIDTNHPQFAIAEEWPLATFTYLTAVLVSLVIASAQQVSSLTQLVFAGTAAVAVLLSTAHLGKRLKGWRAVFNFGRSWLSREIALFCIFIGTGIGYLSWVPSNRIAWNVATLLGVGTLFSIERVYSALPAPRKRGLHSASTLLTAALLAGVFLTNPYVAALGGGTKLLLYVRRKWISHREARPTRILLSTFRTVVGFLAPTLIWSLAGTEGIAYVVAAVLIGEFVDRCEFYMELEIVTPSRQMHTDLQTRLLAS